MTRGSNFLHARRNVARAAAYVARGDRRWTAHRRRAKNVPGIVGLGKAAELAHESVKRTDAIAALRDALEVSVRKLIPEARQNGSRDHRLPNVLNLTLPGLRGESLVIAMDQRGVALSSGSACKSGSPEPTHVLRAMGLSDPDAHQSVRFSLSHLTTSEDLDYATEALREVLEELATTVRFLSCK